MLSLVSLLPAIAGCAGSPDLIEHPRPRAAIGMLYCGALPLARPGVREELTAQLSARNLDLIACLYGEPWAPNVSPVRWLLPESRDLAPSAALPQRSADARYGYSIERGPLHLTVIETSDPIEKSSEAYLWLMEDLSLTSKPWKVVIMPHPIFSSGAVHVDRVRLDLAELLAQERVALAISAGGAAYLRTERIGATPQESVPYVILGAQEAPGGSAARPEWAARLIQGPCYGLLEATERSLRWSLFDPHGRLADRLELAPPDARTPSRAKFFTASELLAGELPQEPETGNEKKAQ